MRYFRLFDYMSDPEGDLYRENGEFLEFLKEDGEWGRQESYNTPQQYSRAEDWFSDLLDKIYLSGLPLGSYREVECPES